MLTCVVTASRFRFYKRKCTAAPGHLVQSRAFWCEARVGFLFYILSGDGCCDISPATVRHKGSTEDDAHCPSLPFSSIFEFFQRCFICGTIVQYLSNTYLPAGVCLVASCTHCCSADQYLPPPTPTLPHPSAVSD